MRERKERALFDGARNQRCKQNDVRCRHQKQRAAGDARLLHPVGVSLLILFRDLADAEL